MGFGRTSRINGHWTGCLVARAVIGIVILGGAFALVALGLRVASDFLPPRGLHSGPMRYRATVVTILVLPVLAIPLTPIALLAWGIVATAGPVVDWLLTRGCVRCALARRGAVGPDPCSARDTSASLEATFIGRWSVATSTSRFDHHDVA